MNNKTIFEEAQEYVSGAKVRDYGHPNVNFATIANLWNAFLRNKLEHIVEELMHSLDINPNTEYVEVIDEIMSALQDSPLDVSKKMVLFKVARTQSEIIGSDIKRDTYVDMAGYVKTASMIQGWEE